MVLIPPLEGAAVQAALGGFAVLAAGFVVTESGLGSEWKPEKQQEAMKHPRLFFSGGRTWQS